MKRTATIQVTATPKSPPQVSLALKMHACSWVPVTLFARLHCTVISSSHWICMFGLLQVKQSHLLEFQALGYISLCDSLPLVMRLINSLDSYIWTKARNIHRSSDNFLKLKFSSAEYYGSYIHFSIIILDVQMAGILRKTVQLPTPDRWNDIYLLLFSRTREGLIILTKTWASYECCGVCHNNCGRLNRISSLISSFQYFQEQTM